MSGGEECQPPADVGKKKRGKKQGFFFHSEEKRMSTLRLSSPKGKERNRHGKATNARPGRKWIGAKRDTQKLGSTLSNEKEGSPTAAPHILAEGKKRGEGSPCAQACTGGGGGGRRERPKLLSAKKGHNTSRTKRWREHTRSSPSPSAVHARKKKSGRPSTSTTAPTAIGKRDKPDPAAR